MILSHWRLIILLCHWRDGPGSRKQSGPSSENIWQAIWSGCLALSVIMPGWKTACQVEKGGEPMAINLAQGFQKSLPLGMEWREEGQTFAWLLRRYRKVQGYTQEELAETWGYSFETISAWEREKRFPARAECVRLAHLLGMDADELIALIVSRRADRTGKETQREQRRNIAGGSEVPTPFEQGRLFWTLHLGIEHGRLQCVISCPLASGEVWEVPLDSVTEGEAIRQLHLLVHEQVSKVAGGSSESRGGSHG